MTASAFKQSFEVGGFIVKECGLKNQKISQQSSPL